MRTVRILSRRAIWTVARGQHRAIETIATAQHDSRSEVDAAIRDLQAFIELKEARLEALKKLRVEMKKDPLPPGRIVGADAKPIPPEARAGPIPISVFRERLYQCSSNHDRELRTVIRQQLFRCTVPYDMLKILVICMTHPTAGPHLAGLYTHVFRALYRCREKVSDRHVLRTLLQYILRFELGKIPIPIAYFKLAVKFGARCRDPALMRRCLQRYKQQTSFMTDDLFRAVIAKCSIGHRKLGTIRNGHWKPAEIREVLLGFECERDLPVEKQCHMKLFYDPSRWEYVHGWISALALARAYDELWVEWSRWKGSSLRKSSDVERADRLFLAQLAQADNLPMLWKLLNDSGARLQDQKPWVLLELLRGAAFAGGRSTELRDLIIERHGTVLEEHGISCQLDAIDDEGSAIMSQETSKQIYEHLTDEMSWKYQFIDPARQTLITH